MAEPYDLRVGPLHLTLEDHARLARAPKLRPEQQWWNLPAKIQAGRQIADQELARSNGHHNDAEDAVRHARWSQRMATEIGPVFSGPVGVAHEVDGLVHGQPISEATMDLHNNGEGLRAARRREVIDPSRLRRTPISPGTVATKGYN